MSALKPHGLWHARPPSIHPPSRLVAYWTLSNLGTVSSSVVSLHVFILFMGFLRQEYWSGLSFLPPVECILSELSTVIHLSWVILQGMVHSFTELHKPLHHDKAVIHEGEAFQRAHFKYFYHTQTHIVIMSSILSIT